MLGLPSPPANGAGRVRDRMKGLVTPVPQDLSAGGGGGGGGAHPLAYAAPSRLARLAPRASPGRTSSARKRSFCRKF